MSRLVELPIGRYKENRFADFAADRDFSPGNVRALAWMSQLAYESDRQKIKEILKGWGLSPGALLDHETRSILPVSHTKGLIASGHGATIVAFSGTDPLVLANWLTDFSILTTTDGVHEGFTAAAASVRDEVSAAVKAARAARQAVFFCGHSLGAALAALAAEALDDEMQADIRGVHAFGMPRTGNAQHAAAYNGRLGARTFRLVHGEDIVATVPPSKVGYRHVGRMLSCRHRETFALDAPPSAEFVDRPDFEPDPIGHARTWITEFVLRASAGSRDEALEALLEHVRNGADDVLIAAGLAALPVPIRDHLPDRYLQAVGAWED